MRVGFVHWGVPRRSDASIRSWRALSWIARRHATRLVVLSGSESEHGSSVSERCSIPGVEVTEPIIVPTQGGWLSQRLRPFTPASVRRRIAPALCDRLTDCDWVWCGWWGLPLIEGLSRRLKRGGVTITWDWDALSLWHLTAARALALQDPVRAILRLEHAAAYLMFEMFRLRDIDVLSTPSLREARWLRRMTRKRCVRVRNCVDAGTLTRARSVAVSDTGSTAIFVGSLDYGPNRDAVLWFCRKVWPLVVREIPEARFKVVGRRTGRYLEEVRGLPGVEVIGEVADVQPWYAQARVVVVPVWYGGGIPNKVLEAAACARPVVTTPYVAGTLGASPLGMRIAGKTTRFAADVIATLQDPRMAEEQGRDALRWVSDHFSERQWADDMTHFEECLQTP